MYRKEGSCEVNLRNFWDVSNIALKVIAIFLLIIAACAALSLLIQCCCCCCCSADVKNSKISNDVLKNFGNLKFQNSQNCPNQRLNDSEIDKNGLILS